MELPEDFFGDDDSEVLTALAGNLVTLTLLFEEGGTTEALRMAAASLRAGADRFELIAERVEAG